MASQVWSGSSAPAPVMAKARAAVARAQAGEAGALELPCPPRLVLRDLLDEDVLSRAIVLLERDGDHGRIVIVPRRHKGPPSLSELLEEDHRRLDELAEHMCKSAQADAARAVTLAHLFAAGMRRHVTAEETILFPPYEAHFGPTRTTTTAAMEREHRAILHYLDRLLLVADKVLKATHRQEPLAELLRVYRGLTAVVGEHSDKEERAMFPLLDRTLKDEQRADLLRQLVLF